MHPLTKVRYEAIETVLRRSFTITWMVMLWGLCSVATAQLAGRIAGTVTDGETGAPLSGAHAFLGATMIGTVTDSEGRFLLEHVPQGTHMLWISMLGFEPTSEELVVSDTARLDVQLSLAPTVIPVGELTVTAKRDKRWRKRLEQFNKMFLGESMFARDVSILNPEALDFQANWLGKFVAKAQEPLNIENRALGYRIEYVLKEFSREGSTIRYDGDPLFEELEPDSEDERAFWLENREEAYFGSFRHFLLALMAGRVEEEGFVLRRVPSVDDIPRTDRRFGIDPHKMLEPGPSPGDLLLSFHGVVEITYLHEEESLEYMRWKGASPSRRPEQQRSWIRLTSGPTLIDPSGEIVDPYGVTVYGYYAFERLAHDLPKEYRIESIEAVNTRQRP